MEHTNFALTHEEALEILTYLLTSAHGGLSEDYGVYRLASAADRLARFWEPRANSELKEYLHELGTKMQTNVANLSVDVDGFSNYLNEQIASLSEIVKEQGFVGGDD